MEWLRRDDDDDDKVSKFFRNYLFWRIFFVRIIDEDVIQMVRMSSWGLSVTRSQVGMKSTNMPWLWASCAVLFAAACTDLFTAGCNSRDESEEWRILKFEVDSSVLLLLLIDIDDHLFWFELHGVAIWFPVLWLQAAVSSCYTLCSMVLPKLWLPCVPSNIYECEWNWIRENV